MNLKKQLRRLLLLETVGYFRPAGAIWVLLLANRGFTLAEIGLAEGFFHLVSLCCEVPSGLLADLLGRKRALAIGQFLFALSAIAMIFSNSLAGIYVNMLFTALGFNLASGTREAITYDSLLLCGAEERYLTFSSQLNIAYRLTAAAATLCAGGVVLLGYRGGYTLDVIFALGAMAIALSLHEPLVTEGQKNRFSTGLGGLPKRLAGHVKEVGKFLSHHPRAVGLMVFNALAGAFATLLGFYLQDGLSANGASAVMLGPLLIAVGLGGALGSRLAPVMHRLPYRLACVLSCTAIFSGYLLVATGVVPLMALGGFLTTMADDALQTLTDARLNAGLPSDQRATLISVSSMCFSVVMVVLSPLAGALAGT